MRTAPRDLYPVAVIGDANLVRINGDDGPQGRTLADVPELLARFTDMSGYSAHLKICDGAHDFSLGSIASPLALRMGTERCLDIANGVSVFTHKWDKTEMRQAGFGAANVRLAFPEAIHEDGPLEDYEGKQVRMLTMSDRPIMAGLVNSTKELNAM